MPILRGASLAVIDPRKLTHYCLDPDSRLGRHKARAFAAALGIDRSHAADLIAAIRAGILVHEARHMATTTHGEIWQVDVPVTGPAGSAVVRTGWIYEEGSDVPRLTTAFVRRRRRRRHAATVTSTACASSPTYPSTA